MLLGFIDSGMQNNLQEGADLLKEQQSLHVYIERYLKKIKIRSTEGSIYCRTHYSQ